MCDSKEEGTPCGITKLKLNTWVPGGSSAVDPDKGECKIKVNYERNQTNKDNEHNSPILLLYIPPHKVNKIGVLTNTP